MTKFGKKRNSIRDNLNGKKKYNPFEIHINHSKFETLGQKSKDDRGIPGISRSKAIKKREKSLLKEYKDRFKSGKLVDKRIGENNPFMDPEQKMILRLTAEKRREFSKKNIFNLNDEEELTHKGEALNDATLNDKNAFSDDDSDDEMLDADYVKKQHFGGDFLTKQKSTDSQGEGKDKHKSKKEWIEEIIAESKRKKSETKKDKEEQVEGVTKLDSQYQEFMKFMRGTKITDEEKEKSTKTCDYRSYDMSVKELQFDKSKRAKPTDRLKSEEELAQEKKSKLEALEADRLRRMRGDFDEDSTKITMQQSTNDNDDICSKKDIRFHLCYKDGTILEDQSNGVKLPITSSNVQTNQRTHNQQESDSDDESDQYSDILDSSENDAEEETDSDNKNQIQTEKEIFDKAAAEKELPYIFEVPDDYDSFWNLLHGRTPSEFSVILERMVSCNHPKLGNENKNKCNTLFAYLLQTLHMLCSINPEILHDDHNCFSYINPMVPYLFKLTSLSPPDCASALTQVIDEKYQDYLKNNKKYPHADTFIFLKVSGLIFPASDYHHEVMTKVATILAQFLGESKVNNRREITCLLFTAALLHEYLKRCGRFIGELSNALRGILNMCIPTDEDKLQLPYTLPFRRVGLKADLLVLEEKVEIYDPPKLSLANLNEDLEITDQFKICAAHESLRILISLTKTWAHLPSARSLFSLVTKILTKFPLQNYPLETDSLVQQLQKVIGELPPHPQHIVKEQGASKTLRMCEPKLEKIVDGFKKKRGTKEHQEKQKLLHKVKRERKGAKRELRRDGAFLAREQLKEVMKSDAERKRKVNLIMQGLSSQESDFKKSKAKSKYQ